MSKAFQKRWRKRNGKGCTYANCDCAGPMDCMHGENRVAVTTTQRALPLPVQGTLSTTHDDKGKYAAWWNAHKDCYHSGEKVLFRINESDISATTIGRAQRDSRAKLVLQCADVRTVGEPPMATLPAGYEALRAHTHTPPPTIILPWPDFGLPPVYRSFWAELIKLMPAGRVVVACQGSHGRTGTALAALLITHLHMTATEAVEYVRKVHCEHAVESNEQMDYLGLLAKWDSGELGATRV